MGQILVGICGWTEPTLIKAGTFYPSQAKTPEERLRFYATQFPIVEVDSTYYSPPTEQSCFHPKRPRSATSTGRSSPTTSWTNSGGSSPTR